MLGSPFGGAPGASGAFGGIPPWMLGMLGQNSGQQQTPGQNMGAPMVNAAPQFPASVQGTPSVPFAPQLGNLGGLNQLPGLLGGVGGTSGLMQMLSQMRPGVSPMSGAAATPSQPPNGLLQWLQGIFSHGGSAPGP